jgi:hypothetical protein
MSILWELIDLKSEEGKILIECAEKSLIGGNMPVHKTKGGYKYGSTGKVYKKKSDAEKQGRAIAISKARKKGYKISTKNECDTDAMMRKRKRDHMNETRSSQFPTTSKAAFKLTKKK